MVFTPSTKAELQTAVNAWIGGDTSTNPNISLWDVSNVNDMSNLFEYTNFNEDISAWNTISVTNMRSMFYRATSFNQNIGGWNTSSVTTMQQMFDRATAFNQNISGWNTSSVTHMGYMFSAMFDATQFNGDISGWDVSSVTDMGFMFSDSQFDGDISGWDVSSVTNMDSMFKGSQFNGDISGWNVSSVTNMVAMFGWASFDGDISGWNVSSVRNMIHMFNSATSFNQNITGWNTSSVTHMGYMFSSATSFNQNIRGWNTNNVTAYTNMFTGATAMIDNQSATTTPTLAYFNQITKFSSVSPSTNTIVNTTAVGYTLSEAIASGSVVWTRTGGTADGNSPHTVALTVTELNTGARGYAVLTNAPTLVDGTIYTIAFNSTDSAGNTSGPVSVTGITFDNTAPTFSSVSPSTNTIVNTTAVGYTLSEAIASGSVVWTRTGGTADGNSPHTVALTVTELNTGARGYAVLTNAPTLVDGTIYTIAFNSTDSAGNTSVPVSVTGITFDNTAPTISHLFSQLDSTIPYSAWSQLGSDIDGEAANDQSGRSVSLSADGRTVAIGGQYNSGNGSWSGHTRIYSYSAGSWAQLGSDIDGEVANDESGNSVSLSADGRTVAIGAYKNDAGNAADDDRGHVRIFSYNGTAWTQLGSDIDGEAANDQSGFSVSLSADGRTVAIGANQNDAGNASDDNRGHVRIYSYSAGSWAQLGSDIDGEAAGDESGYSVSLSADGRTVAIGALVNDSNGNNSGHTRIYSYSAGSWAQLGSDIDGEAANDLSGRSVSLSADGRTVAIGANVNDGAGSNSGHVRIFSYSSSAWTQLGSDIDGEAANDESGYSVSLSDDGRTVAIGAPFNDDGNAADDDRGHVRIYSYNGNAWAQLGSDIVGEAADDQSGQSVSLSADGRTVAIGGQYNSGNGSWSGHVRIYNIKSSYNTSDTITVGVVFSEPVNITNTPVLNVLTNLDETTKSATYASGDGTNVLYFTKTISAGETIDPLKILTSIQPTLTGGTIKDSALNDAVLTLSSDITFHSVIIGVILNALACFPKGTPINTDDGIIEIQDIIPSRHTIRGNNVRAIVMSQWTQGNMILFKKNCLYKNVPSSNTLISMKHQIYYDGNMLDADCFVLLNKAEAIPHTINKPIYNVLLDKHDKMITNNMIVETQNPNSMIGYLYNNFLLNDQISKQSINIAVNFTNEFAKMNWDTYFVEQVKKHNGEGMLYTLKAAFIEYQVKQLGKSRKKVKRIMNKLLPT